MFWQVSLDTGNFFSSFTTYTKGAFSLLRRVLPLLCVLIPMKAPTAMVFLGEGWKWQLQLANHRVSVSRVQKPKVPDGFVPCSRL